MFPDSGDESLIDEQCLGSGTSLCEQHPEPGGVDTIEQWVDPEPTDHGPKTDAAGAAIKELSECTRVDETELAPVVERKDGMGMGQLRRVHRQQAATDRSCAGGRRAFLRRDQ